MEQRGSRERGACRDYRREKKGLTKGAPYKGQSEGWSGHGRALLGWDVT